MREKQKKSTWISKKTRKNSHAVCVGLFSPYKMRGGYFSSCASTRTKISTSHLGLLQRPHILREQKHRLFKPKKQILPYPP